MLLALPALALPASAETPPAIIKGEARVIDADILIVVRPARHSLGP